MQSNLYNIVQEGSNESYFQALIATMRSNLLWFIPLCVWIMGYFVIPNAKSGYHDILMVAHRFTWGLFFSPSAYLFFTTILESLFLPIQLLLIVPTTFVRDSPLYKRRYVVSIFITIAIAVSAVLLQLIITGSFPLTVDKDGHIFIRVIPFVPWPDWSGWSN